MQHRLCRRRQGGCGTRILLSTDFPIPSACRRSAKSKSRFSPCRWRGKVAAEQGFSSPLVCSLCLPAINEIKRPLFALPLARQVGCGTRILLSKIPFFALPLARQGGCGTRILLFTDPTVHRTVGSTVFARIREQKRGVVSNPCPRHYEQAGHHLLVVPGLSWLRNKDSNLDRQIQRLQCYPYTIPQYGAPRLAEHCLLYPVCTICQVFRADYF